MCFFFCVQEEIQCYQQQERSSESCDGDMRRGEYIGILVGIEDSQVECRYRIDTSYDRYDDERKKYSHPEDGYRYSSGQKSMLPFSVHLLEDGRIDDSIIE